MTLAISVLTSCGPTYQPVEIKTEPVKVAVAKPTKPKPIELQPIKWKVINKDEVIYYGLTVKDYETLAVNMQEIKSYLSAQKNIIKYYEAVTAN